MAGRACSRYAITNERLGELWPNLVRVYLLNGDACCLIFLVSETAGRISLKFGIVVRDPLARCFTEAKVRAHLHVGVEVYLHVRT